MGLGALLLSATHGNGQVLPAIAMPRSLCASILREEAAGNNSPNASKSFRTFRENDEGAGSDIPFV